MKNYIQNIRKKIGHDNFIHPAARIIIENDSGEILFIERADNGNLGLPAGAIEESETIQECIIREVYEETGLKIFQVEVIGISTNPELETVNYPNGDKIQYFTIEFYSNKWEGPIKLNDPAEVKEAKFMNIEAMTFLPKNERSTFESLKYYRANNTILLK